MTQTLPITTARKELLQLAQEAHKLLHRFIFTYHGKPEAVLMSYEEYEGWLETLDIVADRKFDRGLKEAEKDVKKGRLYTIEEVFKKKK